MNGSFGVVFRKALDSSSVPRSTLPWQEGQGAMARCFELSMGSNQQLLNIVLGASIELLRVLIQIDTLMQGNWNGLTGATCCSVSCCCCRTQLEKLGCGKFQGVRSLCAANIKREQPSRGSSH